MNIEVSDYDVKQVFNVVNSLSRQAFGRNAIQVVDNQGLIALGDTVMSTKTHTEKWLDTISMVFTRDIFVNRAYKSKFNDLLVNSYQWGNAVRKIRAYPIEAEEDDIYNLEDGQSIDHYQVKKPRVAQKIFTSITPWSYHISHQDVLLSDSFNNATQMAEFLNMIYSRIQMSIEMGVESMGRNCLNNYIGELLQDDSKTSNGKRVVHLLTDYNNMLANENTQTVNINGELENSSISGTIGDSSASLNDNSRSITLNGSINKNRIPLTKDTALQDKDFLKYCSEMISYYSDRMEDATTLFTDDEEYPTHTPKKYQKLYVNSLFENKMKFNLLSDVWHNDLVKMTGYKTFNFWQSSVFGDEMKINIKLASNGKEVNQDGIIAVLFDREACGIYKNFKKVVTTPINARGLYYNTYWHLKKQYFNDLTENGVVFVLD